MNVALTTHWEGGTRQLIESGRYTKASEVVRAALRKLKEVEGERFREGSLKHLTSIRRRRQIVDKWGGSWFDGAWNHDYLNL